MPLKFVCTASAIALLTLASMEASTAMEQTVVFAFDISDSAPVAINTNIAASAGNIVRSIVEDLSPDDQVKMRSLGEAGIAVGQINVNITLGRKVRVRADRMGPALGKLVRSFPERVKRGELEIQTRTNIVGFVEALAPSLDCENVRTQIVIFTDGIEWSTQVRGDDLLSGKADLPKPSGPILKGCFVEMRGLGQQTAELGTDSRWFNRLNAQWTTFFTAAGVASFKAYAAFE